MRRREFLGLAALPLAQAFNGRAIDASRGSATGIDGRALDRIDLDREWTGSLCRTRATNRSGRAVAIKEIVLLDVDLSMPDSTTLYGDGFQMLSQTGGTLGSPLDFSQYTDARHYRIPGAAGARAYFGLLTLTPPGKDTSVLAFTSCARFSGRFEVYLTPAAPERGGIASGRRRVRAVID